jgi:alkylhydroperoxidase/carboxymuconolactone decarboxylase family protein YurZ
LIGWRPILSTQARNTVGTEMSTEKLFGRIPALTRENYHLWKIGISAFLRDIDALDIVTGKTAEPPGSSDDESKEALALSAWEKKNAKALNYIILSIGADHYGYVESCTTGTEAWAALKEKYEKSGRANRVALKHQLYSCQHDPERPIQDFIDEITTLWRRLGGIGVRLTEADIVDVFLFNLHESWSSAASSLCISLKDDAVIGDVEGALRDEEKRRQGQSGGFSDFAGMARTGRSGRRPQASARGPAPNGNGNGTNGNGNGNGNGAGPTCYRCQQRGHIAKYCNAPAPVAEANGGETSNYAMHLPDY